MKTAEPSSHTVSPPGCFETEINFEVPAPRYRIGSGVAGIVGSDVGIGSGSDKGSFVGSGDGPETVEIGILSSAFVSKLVTIGDTFWIEDDLR